MLLTQGQTTKFKVKIALEHGWSVSTNVVVSGTVLGIDDRVMNEIRSLLS